MGANWPLIWAWFPVRFLQVGRRGYWVSASGATVTLTINDIGGWRLPSLEEMVVLFQEGIGVSTPGPFNIPFNPNSVSYFWFSTVFDASQVHDFDFNNGFQSITPKDADNHAWAVHDGDVVPIPAALWLFGSGLLGLIGMARKKAA